MKSKVLCVVGARPNFMKIAPILRAMRAPASDVSGVLVHTGQHYDPSMNDQFFEQLSIPRPDVSLNVGSGSHAVQTAEIMSRFEPVLEQLAPDAILVVGDVNSTIACALVAAKKGVRVVHVEAGLRSWDRKMPEEVNRVLTDQISDRLYVTEATAIDNLTREGVDASTIVFAGNVMIDSVDFHRPQAVPGRHSIERARAGLPVSLALGGGEPTYPYGLVTLHRPSNVDNPVVLGSLVELLAELAEQLPLVCPLHPRTLARLESFDLLRFFDGDRLLAMPPQGYLEMLGLMKDATLVATDSGGIQEETTALGIPCLTLRDSTERPITLTHGTNRLVGISANNIRREFISALSAGVGKLSRPEHWDGRAAERIVDDLGRWLKSRPQSNA